jgi:SAM-dependent methyltransferase
MIATTRPDEASISQATRCAICGTPGNADQVYASTCPEFGVGVEVFSARRLPDGLHGRIVRCRACGLLRTDPMLPAEALHALYRDSRFSYSAETPHLARTYGRALRRLDDYGARHGALLEIGCGNGFFLAEALRQGYRTVRGVEPSADAASQARADLGRSIVVAPWGPDLFPDGSFDVVCLFQVFDHFADPGPALHLCRRVLRDDGLLLCVTHNAEALSARVMGERSPIVDYAHPYLYSPDTLARVFRRHGFDVERTGPIWNRCSVMHVSRLLPFSPTVKGAIGVLLGATPMARAATWLPLGNLALIARKPPGGGAVSRRKSTS